MKPTNSFDWLTTEEERMEYFQAVKQDQPILQEEQPQPDFKGGHLRLLTIRDHWYDNQGYDRKHGTFTEEGLRQLGIDLNKATLVKREAL
jgi:hypothetical protein